MNWNEIVELCLENLLEEAKIRRAGLTAELAVQTRLVESIKAELKESKKKEEE